MGQTKAMFTLRKITVRSRLKILDLGLESRFADAEITYRPAAIGRKSPALRTVIRHPPRQTLPIATRHDRFSPPPPATTDSPHRHSSRQILPIATRHDRLSPSPPATTDSPHRHPPRQILPIATRHDRFSPSPPATTDSPHRHPPRQILLIATRHNRFSPLSAPLPTLQLSAAALFCIAADVFFLTL